MSVTTQKRLEGLESDLGQKLWPRHFDRQFKVVTEAKDWTGLAELFKQSIDLGFDLDWCLSHFDRETKERFLVALQREYDGKGNDEEQTCLSPTYSDESEYESDY